MVGTRIRALLLATAVLVGAGLAATPAQAAPDGCGGWKMDTVAQGLGELENLEPDGNGGFFLSSWTPSTGIKHIDATGNIRQLVTMPAGGMQLDGSDLYVVGGADGGFWRLDTTTNQLTLLGPVGGNGLLRMPNGDLLTTWVGTEGLTEWSGLDGFVSRGVSRYRHDTGAVEANWSPVPRSEGLALSPDGRSVYTDDLVTGEIVRIPLDDPGRWSVVARVPGVFAGVDDLTMSRAGALYVASHWKGRIDRVDPTTGATCVVTSGIAGEMAGPSSVRIAPDGNRWALYVTAFDGTLRRIRPPAEVDLTPVS